MPKKTRITGKPGPGPGCNTTSDNSYLIFSLGVLLLSVFELSLSCVSSVAVHAFRLLRAYHYLLTVSYPAHPRKGNKKRFSVFKPGCPLDVHDRIS